MKGGSFNHKAVLKSGSSLEIQCFIDNCLSILLLRKTSNRRPKLDKRNKKKKPKKNASIPPASFQ